MFVKSRVGATAWSGHFECNPMFCTSLINLLKCVERGRISLCGDACDSVKTVVEISFLKKWTLSLNPRPQVRSDLNFCFLACAVPTFLSNVQNILSGKLLRCYRYFPTTTAEVLLYSVHMEED